jgi:hypothetical protein
MKNKDLNYNLSSLFKIKKYHLYVHEDNLEKFINSFNKVLKLKNI